MIIGIGQDICDVKRIELTINRFGNRFKNRIFTEREINKCESRFNSIDSYARRFAAKEACSKALGTGFRKGVFYKDIEVVNLKSGKPTIKLNGGALDQYRLITLNHKDALIEISLTDDKKLALAIVIISD
jgi:holo-[acyl-carrier protein] synthase|tara:strand:+ start:793 stop:1182 length:390 start_codon:yes stop_codon:yes gene_type:complete